MRGWHQSWPLLFVGVIVRWIQIYCDPLLLVWNLWEIMISFLVSQSRLTGSPNGTFALSSQHRKLQSSLNSTTRSFRYLNWAFNKLTMLSGSTNPENKVKRHVRLTSPCSRASACIPNIYFKYQPMSLVLEIWTWPLNLVAMLMPPPVKQYLCLAYSTFRDNCIYCFFSSFKKVCSIDVQNTEYDFNKLMKVSKVIYKIQILRIESLKIHRMHSVFINTLKRC
jgi:hypothetical protein